MMTDVLDEIQEWLTEGLGDSPPELVYRALMRNYFAIVAHGGPPGDVLLDERLLGRLYPDMTWTREMVAEAVEDLHYIGWIKRCESESCRHDTWHFYTPEGVHGLSAEPYHGLPWRFGRPSPVQD